MDDLVRRPFCRTFEKQGGSAPALSTAFPYRRLQPAFCFPLARTGPAEAGGTDWRFFSARQSG